MNKKDNLIWIDLEFSGLDFKNNDILEIATIVTDKDLNILEKGPNIAIKTKKDILESMDDWNKKTHSNSGLVTKCLESSTALKEAENETLDFLKKWTQKGESPICGNSIGQDKRMLLKYMPELSEHFHYRVIDVSTIKELSQRWDLGLEKFKKEETHTALHDIEESIEELKYYKDKIFKI